VTSDFWAIWAACPIVATHSLIAETKTSLSEIAIIIAIILRKG
jgi:hypothetical protein